MESTNTSLQTQLQEVSASIAESQSFAELWSVEMERRGEQPLNSLLAVYQIQDDSQFMASSDEAFKEATNYLKDCKEISTTIKNNRMVFTKMFDSVKSFFTEREAALEGKSDNIISRITKGRQMLLSRVAEINAKAKVEAEAQRQAAMADEQAKLISAGMPEQAATVMAEIISEQPQETAQPAFKANFSVHRVPQITKPIGYANLFINWFNSEGNTKSVEELNNFKLSSLLTWAKKIAKDGTYIECDGVEYIDEAKSNIRKMP